MAAAEMIRPSVQKKTATAELAVCSCGADMSDPRLLRCTHAVGACCLKPEKKGNVTVVICPQCCTETSVPEADVALLPQPLFLRRLQAAELGEQGKKPSCDLCETAAKVRCEDCEQFFCSTHNEVHFKIRALKNHVLISLTKAGSSSVQQSLCRRHNFLAATNYCKTCRCVMCAACKGEETHSSHDYCDLNEHVQHLEPKIRATLKLLQLPEETRGDAKSEQDAVMQQYEALIRKEEFLRRRTEQILSAGSQEEKIVFNEFMSSQLRKEELKSPMLRGSLVYAPPGDKVHTSSSTTDCRLTVVSTTGEKIVVSHGYDVTYKVISESLSKDQKYQLLEVGTLLQNKYSKNYIARVTALDQTRQQFDWQYLNNKVAYSGSPKSELNSFDVLSTYIGTEQ